MYFYNSAMFPRYSSLKYRQSYGMENFQTKLYSKEKKLSVDNYIKNTEVQSECRKRHVIKTVGLTLAAAFLAYKGRNVIKAAGSAISKAGTNCKNYLSTHTKGSVHEALSGVYHAVKGTGKVISAPFNFIGKLFKAKP